MGNKNKAKKPVVSHTVKVGRDAKNGQFITVDKAKKRKSTATVETIKHY